jgi:hypothetical protein
MILRAVILLALLAALSFYLDREQRAGRFQKADESYLDVLLANARDRFDPKKSGASDDVVFVSLREEDRAEYSAWPPAPLDWQMILKSLAVHEPDVLVIPTPLVWSDPAPEFLPQLAEALLPFPSVVLGAECMTDAAASSKSVTPPEASFPGLARLDGDVALLPALTRFISLPDPVVCRQMEIGIVGSDTSASSETAALPLAARVGEKIAPSLVLQSLSRHSRTPYARQRLRLGAGAGAYLGQGLYVPLTQHGSLSVEKNRSIPVINALDLMTGDLAKALSPEDETRLGKGKIIVVGIDKDAGPSLAKTQALALSQSLAMPRVRELQGCQPYLIWGGAAVLGVLLLRFRASRALRWGVAFIFLAFAASFLLFQSSLTWCPPAIPAALIAVSALFAMLFGARTPALSSPS